MDKRTFAFSLLLTASMVIGQNSAPSSHFIFDDRFDGDIVINEVRVPKSGEAMYTYYEALGWRGGAAGYAGIQVHPRGHNYIFSIWDHKKHTGPIRAVHRGPGTLTEKFGGEGTGLKSWNFELGWEPDTWYTLVSRSWDEAAGAWGAARPVTLPQSAEGRMLVRLLALADCLNQTFPCAGGTATLLPRMRAAREA